MKLWIHRLASLKITVTLLALIMLALAAGTIVESAGSSELALRTIYMAGWFRLLLAAFAVNVACSLVDHWPWRWQRAGFALTHGSMLVILAGSLVTDQLKIEGRLALWEGEAANHFVESSLAGPGAAPSTRELPFTVRLDAFEIDTYPGTNRPAMFRSRVTVTEPGGRSFPAVIEMNRELSHAGYRLFQSSYQRAADRDQSVLLVSRDPGQWIVFAGYGLLMAGMTTVLATRIAQRRAKARGVKPRRKTRPPRRGRRVAAAMIGAAMLTAPTGFSVAASPLDPAAVEALRALPVQHDGRVMPLDTLAREAVWRVTGGSKWGGEEPVGVVLGWLVDHDVAASRPVVPIGSPALAAEIGLAPTARRASFDALAGNGRLMEFLSLARAEASADRPLPPLLEQAGALEERLLWMQGFFDGSALRVRPPEGDPEGVWQATGHVHDPSELVALLSRWPAGAAADRAAIDREILYNSLRPSRLSWWILAGASAAAVAGWTLRRRWLDGLALAGLLGGFAVMTWGLAMRWLIAGRIPASNMYESLLFLGWGVGLFAVVAVPVFRNRLVVVNASAMAGLTMLLTDLLPVDPYIHPMPPVLSGTAWLAIHVPIIMLSYSVLALGVLVAHMVVATGIFAPHRRELQARMSDLLYWYIHVGSILLIAGILTGSVWAASSWGRYWGWDPKEVWSLIAFVAYLAILHGRWDRLLGPFGVAAVSILAFWTIIMTYVGVNYVLAVGLHAYGSGGAGVVRWLLVVAAVETLFLGAGVVVNMARNRAGDEAAAPA